MPFEVRILLGIHASASPALDALFLVSNVMGTGWFLAPLVLGAAAIHYRRGDRAETFLWLALGVSTWIILEGLKPLVGRPRPALWPILVTPKGLSFPSGHALATATFFPLLARGASRIAGRPLVLAWVAALCLVLFVSFGRLYLGVHWPTDVLAGWAIGAAQTALGVHVRDLKAPRA